MKVVYHYNGCYECFDMVICPKCNSDIKFYIKGSEKLHGK